VFIHEGNIALSVSTDDGKTWTNPAFAIDAEGKAQGGMQRGPRVAVDRKKRITVSAPVCLGEHRDQAPPDLFITISVDGGKTFGKPLRVNDAKGKAPEALHALAVSESGEAHLAWLDMRDRHEGQDLYYCKVTEGKVSKNLRLAKTLCECCAPGIAVDSNGDAYVGFREGGRKPNRSIFLVSSKDGGKTFGSPARVNEGETRVPS
jgi:hypothetical protein